MHRKNLNCINYTRTLCLWSKWHFSLSSTTVSSVDITCTLVVHDKKGREFSRKLVEGTKFNTEVLTSSVDPDNGQRTIN